MLVTNHINDFLTYLKDQRNYSQHTISSYQGDLLMLSNIENNLAKLNNDKLQSIIIKLNQANKSARTVRRFISSIKSFFNYLAVNKIINQHSLDLVMPKIKNKLPKILSYEQILRLINNSYDYPHDLRDRLIISLLYSAALRVSELVNLDVNDIDAKAGFIKVLGKGSQERYVPISDTPIMLIKKYLAKRDDNNKALLINNKQARLSVRSVQLAVKNRAIISGLDIHLHPHMLRHSAASHFLQSSSNIRMTQQYLGHKNITSTQVYTHLDFQKIASVYDKTHPHQKDND